MKSIKTLVAGLALTAVSAAANATVILPGSETPLQQVINGLYQSATCPTCSPVSQAPDVNTDQASPDGLWAIEASGFAGATLIIEIAGNANSNVFGLYDAANPSNLIPLFSGLADQGDKATIYLSDTGSLSVVYFNNGVFAGVNTGFLSGNLFGYYLQTTGGTFYSEAYRNPDGSDQLVAFQGDGDKIKLPGSAPGYWGSSSFILAWEDIRYLSSDKDFNDFVVYVESVTNVPEPGTLALLGLGLAGLGLASRRRAKR